MLIFFQDERFNRDVDQHTGYRTKALLCMPIKDASGDVVGVAQVINKLGGEQCFTKNDEKVSFFIVFFEGNCLQNFFNSRKSSGLSTFLIAFMRSLWKIDVFTAVTAAYIDQNFTLMNCLKA